MARFSKIFVVFAMALSAMVILTPALMAQEKTEAPAPEAAPEADIENLKAIQGEVVSVDANANTVSIKDPKNADPKTNVTTLSIDPKTTTIWGEFDEIKLSDLPVGTKVAGEYKVNPDKSMTATYLEIVTEEELAEPRAEEAPAAEKPVE